MSAILSAKGHADRAPSPESKSPAVTVIHVSKTFRLPHQRYQTLKERALHPWRSRTFDVLRAVQDVSIEIPAGEFFGIVGRNGSGKSTLLKCLAGIYDIDEGELKINGRLSPFIELGVGFNPDLTARDNVIINGIMLGLSRKEAAERFDDVIAFAELEEFVDLKLKNYSSGMYVRLAFATAVQVDADIFLIDEVLAVGDANFQQKCFDELTRLQRAGRTMLFVTHDMGAIERFCDRAMLLERGRVVAVDDPASIARQYNQRNFRRTRQELGVADSELPPENPAAEVHDAVFESPTGEVAITSTQGEPCTVRMDVHFTEDVDDPIFAIALANESGQAVFSTNTDAQRIPTGHFAAGEDASVRLRFDNWLSPGRYQLIASVARAGFGADLFDAHMSNSIIVLADKPGGGLADLPHTLRIERG
ncbi:MAG: ABC transporter ATP-binding protein [Solirubrobacterales bacterium]|nr:ABC transporter ATP-binding protein [Solirubrobacterales bacterium]